MLSWTASSWPPMMVKSCGQIPSVVLELVRDVLGHVFGKPAKIDGARKRERHVL